MSDDLDLKTIFDIVSGWSVEKIRSIMYHKKWTRQGSVPFEKTDKSGDPPALAPERFEKCRTSLKVLLESDHSILNDEETAMIVICSTFLLMNDLWYVRKENLEEIIHADKVKQNILRLLNDMDGEIDGSIKKLQLFYALHKQRENPDKEDKEEIKKITWSGVTSSWGPKIVMSDGKSYYYIFNDFTEFDEYRKKYNIAAKLGETEQYRSEYVDEGEDFNLRIIGVIATVKCRTLAEFFTAEKLGEKGKFSESKLPERLSEEFFRNELDASMDVPSDELMAVLPRLTSEDIDPCVDSILKKTDEWNIPRVKITYKNDEGETQTYFVVHGDEWGGNFLVAEGARQVYVIDYEDAIYSNSNNQGEVQQVGGDLSSRIFNPEKMKKTDDSLEDQGAGFSPIGLSVFASIGRLMAALVQYHSRWKELEKDDIPGIVSTYLKSFEKSFGEKESILKNDHWESNYKPMILLHAWDWAIYWKKKKRRFPTKHYDKFIDEIKKLLCGEEAQTDEQEPITYPSPPDTGPRAMPSDNTEAREEKKIQDIIIEKADDDAWDSYSGGDLAKAEANWGIALQMLDEMKSNEDKGYFSYFKTKVAYLRNDDADKAVESLLQCIKFCQDDDDDAYLMEALLFLAYLRRISGTRAQAVGVLNQLVYLYNTGDFEESPESFDNEQLMEWPESEGDYKHTVLCQIKRMVANFFWKFGEYENASRLYENLMQYFEGTQQHDRSDNARVNLGILKSKLGEYEESDKLQNQCLEYRRKEYAKVNDGDTGEITKALRNLGQNAMAWRKFEKAKQYFTKCIDELRDVPSRAVAQNDIKGYIRFIEFCISECDCLIEIRRIQLHERDDNMKVELLMNAMNETQQHKHLFIIPILSNIVERQEAIVFTNSLDEEDCGTELKLEVAKLLYNKFLLERESKRFLNSILVGDLSKELKIEVLLMYETIYFFETHDKGELAQYHSQLEREYEVEYKNIIDFMEHDVWDDEREYRSFTTFFRELTKLNSEQRRLALYDFFESRPSRKPRHLFVRVLVEGMKEQGIFLDPVYGNAPRLAGIDAAKFCLNNLLPISKYYTDSFGDIYDILTLATISGACYAEHNKANITKLKKLTTLLSDITSKLYQTRWLSEPERQICDGIISSVTEDLSDVRSKFDAWSTFLNKITQLIDVNSKRYLYAYLHSAMVWDSKIYQPKFKLKARVRMKEIADILVQWITKEPNVYSLSDEDYRKTSARWLLTASGVPENDWDIVIQQGFEQHLD